MEYVEPAKWCVLEEVEEVRVVGGGFTGNLDMEEASCTFRINDDELLGKEEGYSGPCYSELPLVQPPLGPVKVS